MIDRAQIVGALRQAGVTPGRTVFSHANIAFFGPVEGARSMPDLVQVMLEAFSQALGDDGTLVLPVFTYSFGSDKTDKVFDLQHSLSTTSAMGNALVTGLAGCRSADPMLSVVAVGRRAAELTAGIDPICFGPDSIWARLHAEDALICNLNLDSGSTFLHWVERELGVPYRQDIPMSGTIIDQGVPRAATITYTGRALDDPQAAPRFEAFHRAALAQGVSRTVALGRGQIVAHDCRAARDLLARLIDRDPWVLTARHAGA